MQMIRYGSMNLSFAKPKINSPRCWKTISHITASTRNYLERRLATSPFYGYGVKGFMLSMIETALAVTNNTLDVAIIEKIIAYGKELLDKPIELLEGVEEVLHSLKPHYRLVVATKGDLLDQERKLRKSGIDHYFHHIEIMSDKKEKDFEKLIRHLDILPSEFLMLGNSLKSDILPVLSLGGHAIHIPFHTTWVHEEIGHRIEHANFGEVKPLRRYCPAKAWPGK